MYRYLDRLLNPLLPLTLYLAGWIARAVASRRAAKRPWLYLAVAVPGLPVAALLLGWVAVRFVGVGAAGWLEEQIVLSPWRLLPAAVIAGGAHYWDLWVERTRAGAVLFAPLVGAAVLGLFWSQAEFATALLGHPSWYAVFAVGLSVALVVHRFFASRSAHGSHDVKRSALSLVCVAAALVAVLFGVYRGWQSRAVAAGGGLVRPTMFRFDFADYVSLESEISLSRDLVFLYREQDPPPNRLLRRYVLSGYSPRRGFYRLNGRDEAAAAPPLSVDAAAREGLRAAPLTTASVEEERPPSDLAGRGVRELSQEYYVVNFDPDALVAVNAPTAVEPLARWDDASFNNVYRVTSALPNSHPAALHEASWPRDLPLRWREVYLSGPVHEEVAALARRITAEAEGYYETVVRVRDYLLDEYYYSLNPGRAADGDQLRHFLFESRKGYCSYFAFAMTLMLRSLDIPSRVAVGFFVDPSVGMLGFYPIRGDMAHAWVEVWFDEVGWVEFDPTSTAIAPGEIVNTDYSVDREQLSSLVQEILSRGTLSPRAVEDDGHGGTRGTAVASSYAVTAAAGAVLIGAALMVRRRSRWRSLCRRNPRRAALVALRSTVDAAGLADRSDPAERLPAPLNRAADAADRARFAARFDYGDLQTLVRACRAYLAAHRRELRSGGLRQMLYPRRWYREIRIAVALGISPRVSHSRRPARRGARLGRAAALCMLLFSPWRLPDVAFAREPQRVVSEADEWELSIRRAVRNENYEEALRRIAEARRRFPGDYRFVLLAGDLYYDHELFDLARAEYEEALHIGAPEYSTRYILSRTLSRVNADREAIALLEVLHRQFPEDITVVGDLAWLYYKTHRLEDARDMLEATLAEVGFDRELSVTLATVYAGLWDYEAALAEYERSIRRADLDTDRTFLAVTYYNLSILHANFYRWDEALEAAERSIETEERSSGYRIRAELREQELRIEDAEADYSRAALLDTFTPLADLNLASLRIAAGQPDRALEILESILEEDNRTWMYNYGTDPDRYFQQFYGVFSDALEAAANVDRLHRPGRLASRIARWGRGVYRHAAAWYYRGLHRHGSLTVADSYRRQNRTLLASLNRMLAAEAWSALALRHIDTARSEEARVGAEAMIDYELLTASLSGETDRLLELSDALHGRWHRGNRLEALREVYRTSSPRDPRALSAAARAWAMHPGAFLVHGLRIPISVESISSRSASGGEGATPPRRIVVRTLRRLGFRSVERSPLTLTLEWGPGRVEYRMYDRELERTLRRGEVAFGDGRESVRRALESVAETLTGRRDERPVRTVRSGA
ncbi:MAG: hypothetical protein MI724_03995 [Spirochaetales bacterium]|nr:hypothetical protein [Spirochaetales bacterium]